MTRRSVPTARRTSRFGVLVTLACLACAALLPQGAAAASPAGSNRAPVAAVDVTTTAEDTAVNIDVLANDSDPDGDSPRVTAVGPPAFGMAALNTDGTILYEPSANANGTDSFGYLVDDGAGRLAVGTVTVTVNPVNDLPVTTDDLLVTTLDTPSTIAVLANDLDADDDALIVLSTTIPEHGSTTVEADGSITYFPDPGFAGTDGFDYAISEGAGDMQTARVAVKVTVDNSPPVAVGDRLVAGEDTIGSLKPVANDTDVEGGVLLVTAVTQPGHGSVALYFDGTVAYTPDADYNGPDAFQYTVADGAGAVGGGIVSVVVSPVDDAPATSTRVS